MEVSRPKFIKASAAASVAGVACANAAGKARCLVCHETGVGRAPIVDHGDRIPRLALIVQCRSCHVRIRSDQSSPWDR